MRLRRRRTSGNPAALPLWPERRPNVWHLQRRVQPVASQRAARQLGAPLPTGRVGEVLERPRRRVSQITEPNEGLVGVEEGGFGRYGREQ